jgi:hypothetical protein
VIEISDRFEDDILLQFLFRTFIVWVQANGFIKSPSLSRSVLLSVPKLLVEFTLLNRRIIAYLDISKG